MNKKNNDNKQPNKIDKFEENKLYQTISLNNLSNDKFKENLLLKDNTNNDKDKSTSNKPKFKFKISKKQIIASILVIIFLLSGSFGGYAYMKSNATKKENKRIETVKSNAKEVNISSNLRKVTVKKVKKQKNIPAYSLSTIQQMDMSKVPTLTVSDLKLVTSQSLVGLEESFLNAGRKYNVNPLFLIAIASLESANGTICFKPNNMFGYGSKGYSSKSACIYDVAKGLGTGYLKPGSGLYSGKRISDVNKKYASSSTWDTKVSNNMYKYYRIIHNKRSKVLKSL